ncbi:MAG: DUF1565 domain-containing protein [Phycisphaerales bacterium]|nr:DUF1565 domain-containing protein [Phycisphaerales bacterium]
MMMRMVMAAAMVGGGAAYGGNGAEAVGGPALEMPTMHSLGVYWVVKGDDNKNARVDFSYRKAGTSEWKKAPPLWRVEKGLHLRKGGESSVQVPGDEGGAWLVAGSALLLEPQTEYELKLVLVDPDGGGVEKLLKQSTIGEPMVPAGMKELHVVPGNGGGTGTASDPFKGIASAMAAAGPRTRLLLHKGTYEGPIVINKSGEPGRPIILQGAGDGEAVIDGKSPLPKDVDVGPKQEGRALDLNGTHDVWVEGLTIQNGFFGVNLNSAQRSVVRRCNIHDVHVGIWGGSNKSRVMTGFWISDNVIKGPLPFPCPAALWHKEFTVGIEVGGMGHEICYNSVSNFEDSVDNCELVFPCAAIDFHNNEGYDLADDGSEFDGGERNIRMFYNRYTNSLTGVSFQPVYGGPVYCFRNVYYNFRTYATKLHIAGDTVPQTGGALLVHNTFVHSGVAWFNNGGAPIVNCYSHNNIFLGTEDSNNDPAFKNVDGVCIYFGPKTTLCDFDYDGFSGFKGPRFMKWNGVNYATVEEAREKSGIEKHLIMLDPQTLFASGIGIPERNLKYDASTEKGWGTFELNRYDPKTIDLRLKAGCAAIGVGEVLEGFGDDPKGPAYLGAYAPGVELPWYGPRPVKK